MEGYWAGLGLVHNLILVRDGPATQHRHLHPAVALPAQAGLRGGDQHTRPVHEPAPLRPLKIRRGQEIDQGGGGVPVRLAAPHAPLQLALHHGHPRQPAAGTTHHKIGTQDVLDRVWGGVLRGAECEGGGGFLQSEDWTGEGEVGQVAGDDRGEEGRTEGD